MNKKMKIFKFSSFGLIGVLSLSVTLPFILNSCASSSTAIKNPSLHATSFTSMNKDDLSPIALASLSSTEGRQSLLKTFSNKLLENWFGTISNSTLTSIYNKWVSDAEDSYKEKYDNYKDSKGTNWKILFQKEVLDPVGGTKEDYILNKIYENIKDKFIEIIFKNQYLSVKDANEYVKVDANTKGLISKPENINGTSVGEKNNFAFSEAAIEKNSKTSLDFGIADFLNFLMDDWVFNTLPLPISMSLWKNAANPNTSNLFSLDYFGSDTIGTEGSYNFQYFTPKSKNPTNLTTTDKFELLMTNLIAGKYVDTATGLINLPLDYTEDSSTSMTIEFDKLYSGEISIPFASAALYKLNSTVFGISDANIPTISDSNLVKDSIMKNFLVFNGQSNNNGVFNFPYSVTYQNPYSNTTTSVFLGEYQNATGIKDNINLNGKLDSFILNRNSFGVHLISIDRISKIKEAVSIQSSNNAITIDQYKKACNEIRNTFIYRYAEDVVNGTSKYDIMSSLKTYLSNNFDKILFRYVSLYLNDNSANSNNLFGPAVVNNTANKTNENISSNKYGFNDQTNQEYIDVLTSIDNNSTLKNLLESVILLEKSESILTTWNNLKSKIYANADSYNNISNPDEWKKYGIAGVMSYTRNDSTGNFDSLSNLIKFLIKNVATCSTSKHNNYNKFAINSKTTPTISSSSSEVTNIESASELVSYAKKTYEDSIAKYINSISLKINNTKDYISSPIVVFTNDDYINNSIQANSSASNLTTIAQNYYMQNYLTTQSGFITSTKKRNSSGTFYDFSKNQISYSTTSSADKGSTDWVKQNLQNSINSIYILSNFTDLTNLYSDGNWTDVTSINKIASEIWNNSWSSSQYNFSSSTNTSIVCYENPSNVQEYYKFLITLEYLLDYDATSDKFNWSNLITFLNDATQNNGKALVGWINQSSIKENSNFGLTKDSVEISNIADVQAKIQTNSEFNGTPFLLTKITPYSWFGAPNYYSTSTAQTLQYSADSNYWYTSPTLNSTDAKTSSGFVGFQFQRSSILGTTNKLPTDAFENSTYTNAPTTNNSKISYLGSLYNFGSRENIVEYVKTKLAVVSDLKNFYNNNLLNPGLPIKQETKENIEDIIQDISTNSNKVVQLTNAIVNLLNDKEQVPDSCFTKMEGMPLWNNDGTTLFSVDTESGNAIKNQYIVTQFNYQDVQNLLKDGQLNTNDDGFLGLNPTTFFNCIVDLAMKSSTLQEAAYNNMFEKIGSVAVFDYRLINFIEKVYISNYDDWKEILDL